MPSTISGNDGGESSSFKLACCFAVDNWFSFTFNPLDPFRHNCQYQTVLTVALRVGDQLYFNEYVLEHIDSA